MVGGVGEVLVTRGKRKSLESEGGVVVNGTVPGRMPSARGLVVWYDEVLGWDAKNTVWYDGTTSLGYWTMVLRHVTCGLVKYNGVVTRY